MEAGLGEGAYEAESLALHEDDDDDDTVRPILECVVRHSANSYTAYFGYTNETDQLVTIPIGSKNAFSPSPQNRNQPTTFLKGRSPHYPNAAFSVPFNGSNLTWSLRGPNSHTRTVTAKSSSSRCEAAPSPTPTPTPAATPTPQPGPTPAETCGASVMASRRYTRTCGDHGPTVYNQTFTLPAGSVGPYTLRVVNGDSQGRNKTSSAEVRINGVEVVRPNDFSQTVTTFTKTIATLQATNQIYVKVSSSPGSTFTLNICGANEVDAVPPSVNWIAPLEGELTSDPTPLFRVRYTDLVSAPNLASLKILVDGVDQTGLFNRQPDEASLDGLISLPDGTHTLRAEIKDQAGNLGVSTRTFRVDATGPTIAILTPAGGSVLNHARPQVRLTFADPGTLPSGIQPSSLEVMIDGVDVTSAFTLSGSEATGQPPIPLPTGPHQIEAAISDVAGNSTTISLGFSVDTVPPVITATSPLQGQILGTSTADVVLQYSDNQELNLASFQATIDGTPVPMIVDADSAAGSLSDLPDGSHTLVLSIADRAGNVRTTSTSFTTDTGRPAIAVVTPPSGFVLNLRNPEIRVTFSDTQGINPASLKITVNGVDRTTEFTRADGEAVATLADLLPEGTNTVVAEVRDTASNLGTTSSAFMLDVQPPVVTVAAPLSLSYSNDPTPEIRVVMADALSGVEPTATRIFIDETDVTDDFAVGPLGASGTLSAPLAEGLHTLRVVAADRAANPTVIDTVFHIDLTAPSLDMASPRVNGFTNDATPEIWLRTLDVSSGVDSGSIRVYLLPQDATGVETDITPLLTAGAADTRGEFLVPLTDGSHRLRAIARDLAGNEGEITVGFVVDTSAPLVAIDQPQSDTFLNSPEPTIVLLFSDERSGIASDLIQVKVDGIERATSMALTPTGARLTLSAALGFSLADGPHQIEARVVDNAGNAMEAVPVSFGVDTVPPTAAITSPVNLSFVGAAQPSWAFAVQDASPSSGVNPAFIRVFLDDTDITASATFTSSDGSTGEPLVVGGTGSLSVSVADGVHSLRISAIDNANNQVETSSSFTVDTTGPLLTSDIPEAGLLIGGGALTGGRASVTGGVSDTDPNLTLACSSPTGAGTVSLTNGAYSCSVPVAEGVNAISVTASDSSGHTSTITRSLTVDRIAPVIVISDPMDGAFTAALSLSVTGIVTDSSAAGGLTVRVNGQAAVISPGTAGGPATFEASSVSVGAGSTAAIEVVATDAVGNAATATITVRVDRNAPVVAITQPASGEYLRGGVTTITVDVTDETTTILDINGVPGTQNDCVDVTAETRRCTFTADVPLIAGNSTIVATAFDEAGNRGVNQISAIVDNTPPVISVTSPGPGLITNATTVSVGGSASDDSPLTLTVNGQNVAVAAGGSFSATISNDVLGVPFSGMEGPRAIVFVARDAAGNETTTSVSVFFDRTPPALTVASPLQGAIIPSASVTVSGTVTDASAVTITVQGTPATVTGQAWSTTLASLVEGSLTITVRAVDAAGNESTVVRDVEVDLGPPTVAITSPAAGTLTREATALLAYSVLDRSSTSIRLNGATLTPCPGVVACDRTQSVGLVDGDNTFTVEATDAGGRTASAQVTITRDSDAPIVELLAPETASRGRVATASVSAVDNLAMASVVLRLAGAAGSSVLCSGTSACSGSIVIPDEARPGDSLTLTATATDTAGNVTTTSRTVRVTSDGVITGTVLNDLTSLPLAGATVTLLGPNTRSTTTNEQGRYNIPVADVSAILRIEKAGFTSVDRVVSVISGTGTVPVDGRLTPIAALIRATSVTPSLGEGLGRGPLTLSVPDGDHQVTLLSAQGLPNLLPPGFSPLTAFNWIPDNASAAARATVAMPTGAAALPETILVRYDTAMRDWRVVASGLTAADGVAGVDLIGPGSYALVVPDNVTPPMAIPGVGEPLAGIAIATIPATATSQGRVDPPVLPPTGGTATGLLRIDSPTPLPSGTIVQADLEETYTLSSGEEASAPKRSIDVLVYRTPSLVVDGTPAVIRDTTCAPSTPPATGSDPVVHLCAAFPITPSRTYSNASLREGRVKLDLLAGRENARGVVGGSAAVTVVAGNVQLNVAAGSLDEDTAVSLWSYDDYSPFIPSANGITPLGEVTLDFASSTLNTSAALTFRNVAAAPGDTLVLARVDRAAYDGFPRLQVVALADVVSTNGETNAITRVETGLPGVVLDGIKKEGRYTLLRLAGPIGFITGSTTASGSPVRALVTTNSLPFVATSNSSGVYAIPAVPGSVTVTARVLGQSLIGTAQATAVDGTPVTLNILLEGAVSQATVTPASGATGVEVNDFLTLTSPVALNPTTINAPNITLRTVPTPPATGSTTVPLRFVLSGSGKQLSIIPTGPITTPPTPALAFSTTYALEITGLLDTVGGLVTAPTTTFRTKDDIKPVYNLRALTFSFPNAEGLVTVSAPAGTFPPGTEILIINSGNGVVLGLTAGNDGEVNGTLPAGLSDILMVTVTDPFGNTTSFESSKFVNPATGETAIGPGGGVIEGPQGTAMTIPEGALSEGVAFKVDVLAPDQYDTLFPDQRPAFGTRPIGTVLKVSAAQEGTFNRPVKLTFNVPSNFATTHPGADPRDAVFYALKRSILPSGVVAYEVVDHAFAVCPGDAPGGDLPARDDPANPTCDASELRVKTASPPHPELTGTILADMYILLTYDWSSAGARTALAGTVVGRVRRKAWGSGDQAGQIRYEPIRGATVFGSDSAGNPLQSGNALFTTSQENGTYTLWDSAYTGGAVTVHAFAESQAATGVGYEGNPQDSSAGWGPFPALRFYQNKAHVDVVFEAQAPPPLDPDVAIIVMRDEDRVDTRGLSQVGTALRIGFRNNRPNEDVTIGVLDINGESFTVIGDNTGRFTRITQDAWTPSQAGTYVLRTTALSPTAGTIPVSTTVRILAAGGGVDTDPTQAPRVIDQQTYPKRGAKNVSIAAFPSVAFSEPVVGISYSNVLLTRTDLATGQTSSEAFKISGVTATGQVVPDVTVSPTLPITAITLLPISGLKYKHGYTLRLTEGIVDLDTPPKSLVPETTTFETFGPEPIPPENQPESYTTTGFYLAKDAEGEPVSMWSLKHAFSGPMWLSLLTGYDLSNPVEVTANSSTSFIGRPMDLVGEGTIMAMVTAPGVRSIPSNVRLFDVSNAAAPVEVGAASLAVNVGQGTANRITLRGNRIYAGTLKRGIQVIDTDQMRADYKPCNSQVCDVSYFNMQRDLSTDGVGFATSAAFKTFPVAGTHASFSGIKSIQQSDEPLIVAVGTFGLALAKESRSALLHQGYPAKDADRLDYTYAVDVAKIGGYDIALIAGLAGDRQLLMTVDVTNPLVPTVRGVLEIQTSGRSVVDILIQGTVAYVSTQKTTTAASLAVEVFDLSAIDTIAHLGTIEGVGGRLAISGKLLYGAASSTFGAPVDGLGGVRVAALERLLYFKNAGGPFQTKMGVSAEPVSLELAVVPASLEETGTTVEMTVTKGNDGPQAVPTSGMTAVIPSGAAFDANLDHRVRGRINAGTPDELTTGAQRLRPVEIEFIDTAQGDETIPVDAVGVFSPQPFVEMDSLPTPSVAAKKIRLSGRVLDALAPIQNVLIGSDVVPVTQTGAGPGGMGPFTGTYSKEVDLPRQDVLFSATAVNSVGNSGFDSVWIRANVSPQGEVTARTVLPQRSVPILEPAVAGSSFRIEVKDKGLTSASKLESTLTSDQGQHKVSLDKIQEGLFRSKPLLLVPPTFQVPPGVTQELRDILSSTRIPATLGSKPTVEYVKPSISDIGIASGLEFVGEDGNAVKYVPGVVARPTVQVTAVQRHLEGDHWELSMSGTVFDIVKKANPSAPDPAFSINGQAVPLTGGSGGNYSFTTPLRIALPLPETLVQVRAENSIGGSGYVAAIVNSQGADGPNSTEPEVLFRVDPPAPQPKPLKIRFVGPMLAPAALSVTVGSDMSLQPDAGSTTRVLSFAQASDLNGVFKYETPLSVLGSRVPWHALLSPESPGTLGTSSVIPVEVGGLVTATAQFGSAAFRRNAEVSGLEILTPREGSIVNVLPTSPLITTYETVLVRGGLVVIPQSTHPDPHLVQTLRWHGLAASPSLTHHQLESDDGEGGGTTDLTAFLRMPNLSSRSRHDLLPVAVGQNLLKAEATDRDGNHLSAEAFVYAYLPGTNESPTPVIGDIANPGGFQIERGRFLLPSLIGSMDLVYPAQSDAEISEHLRKNFLRPTTFQKNMGAVVTVGRIDGADVGDPLEEELQGGFPIPSAASLPYPEQLLDSGDITYRDILDNQQMHAEWLETYNSGREYIGVTRRARLIQRARMEKGLPPGDDHISLEYDAFDDKVTKQFNFDMATIVAGELFAPLLAFLGGVFKLSAAKQVFMAGAGVGAVALSGLDDAARAAIVAGESLPRLEPIVIGGGPTIRTIDPLIEEASVFAARRQAMRREFELARAAGKTGTQNAIVYNASRVGTELGEYAAEKVVRGLVNQGDTLRMVCCRQFPSSGGGANGLFDQVWIINEGTAIERVIVIEAKGGKAVNPLAKSFGAGRKVINPTTGAAEHAIQGSPEYFRSVLDEMTVKATTSLDADFLAAVAKMNVHLETGGVRYFGSSATWTRIKLPGLERRVFQVSDKVKVYEFQVASR